MNRPQVLVFIDWYAPGFNAGGPVRSLVNLVDHLRDRIDFHIVTSDTDYMESSPYAGIRADQWTVLPGGERIWYASAAGIEKSTWRGLLAERKWDTVYINGIYSRWFSIMPLWLLRGSTQRRLVAPRGMLASGMMKHGALKKRLFLLAMKLTGCYKGVEFQATNPEERADIAHWLAADAQVHLVPNLARKRVAHNAPGRPKSAGELRLLSVARIAVEKNTLFAIERLRGAQGQVTFDLYGSVYDPGYWKKCQEAIATLPPNIRVSHKGVVATEDVPSLFDGYHALFMPSQGENFGHTMAEALAAGLPLLISDRTPWRGLEKAKAGWDLALDRSGDFHRTLQELVYMDQVQYDAIADGAFAMGTRYLNDPTPIQQSLSMFTR